ncbi:Lrp/AsnC family transcriptional regulator [Nitratireductor pacificus]|uniref:AsnC family transcriptional regulator n=1 Tax=Nitratireductor pacificus pht-3B TaxID=391937 RepID=K2LIY8_9HYPH|nr:Lrp/AsnC family transcriptional regulator [Nitratireductor pacificus]EKF17644.1 AsnC family transcriptional regulator [Nitratireductor pacificus pht-3B]
MSEKTDQFDRRILRELQRDAGLSQRDLAEKVGLSQNACWRRLRALEERGVIRGRTLVLDRDKLGLGLTVFVLVKTRHHSAVWLQTFRQHVAGIPEIVDFFRIGGEYDYMMRIVTTDMASYDSVYQRLIQKVELESVTSYFAMEAIAERRPLPV